MKRGVVILLVLGAFLAFWSLLSYGGPAPEAAPMLTGTPSPTCPPPGSCGCFDVVDPVCGVDGRTYANWCYAFCFACVAVAYQGPCRTPTPTGTPTRVPTPASYLPLVIR